VVVLVGVIICAVRARSVALRSSETSWLSRRRVAVAVDVNPLAVLGTACVRHEERVR
jgi:hypothetical protein